MSHVGSAEASHNQQGRKMPRQLQTRQDQQNSVVDGQRNCITGANSRLISFKHIFTECNSL